MEMTLTENELINNFETIRSVFNLPSNQFLHIVRTKDSDKIRITRYNLQSEDTSDINGYTFYKEAFELVNHCHDDFFYIVDVNLILHKIRKFTSYEELPIG